MYRKSVLGVALNVDSFSVQERRPSVPPCQAGVPLSTVPPIKSPNLSPEGRLLIMIARDRHREADRELLAAAAREVDNWPLVVQRAAEHFILPLAFRALSCLPSTAVPPAVLQEMKRAMKPVIMQSLKFAAEQRTFSEDILRKHEIRHVFMKGQALAGAYYQAPGERYCRDVDLLVDRSSLVQVADLAQTKGYTVYPNRGLLSHRDLVAAARFYPVICLIGPTNILFEVHSKLDKVNLLFDTHGLLDRSDQCTVHGSPLSMLPLAEHFVYVCLHSTRHLWSHLNWLVDMDAMVQHDDFDEAKVLDFARSCGVESTVEACLELYRGCASSIVDRSELSAPAQHLLDSLVLHVEEGPKLEFSLRKDRPYPDFSFQWQATPKYRRRVRFKTRFSSMKPTFKDYKALPLPSRLHWLYYFTRPFTAALRRGGAADSDSLER